MDEHMSRDRGPRVNARPVADLNHCVRHHCDEFATDGGRVDPDSVADEDFSPIDNEWPTLQLNIASDMGTGTQEVLRGQSIAQFPCEQAEHTQIATKERFN